MEMQIKLLKLVEERPLVWNHASIKPYKLMEVEWKAIASSFGGGITYIHCRDAFNAIKLAINKRITKAIEGGFYWPSGKIERKTSLKKLYESHPYELWSHAEFLTLRLLEEQFGKWEDSDLKILKVHSLAENVP